MSMIDGKDAKTRKDHPLFSGCLAYFPDALLAVAALSRIANEKHNPGEPLHWSRDKSSDHADCLSRHQLDAGKIDHDWDWSGQEVRHSTEVAWRALAQLQLEIEAAEKLDLSPGTMHHGPVLYRIGANGASAVCRRQSPTDRRKHFDRDARNQRWNLEGFRGRAYVRHKASPTDWGRRKNDAPVHDYWRKSK